MLPAFQGNKARELAFGSDGVEATGNFNQSCSTGQLELGGGGGEIHAPNTYNCFLEFCLKRETRKYVVARQGVGCN